MPTVETTDYPALTIEWYPGVGPGTVGAAGAGSDITQYVMGGNTFRGRQYELDRFQAGTCSLTLKSRTRLFDPEWTSGTYFGQLLPMAQVRITAVKSAVTYPVFFGYITDWGQTVQADDKTFWTTIQAVDGFVLLERQQLPSSAWSLMVQRDSPTCWLRLGETDTVRVTDSSDGGNFGLYDNVTQGAQGLIPNDANGAIGETSVTPGSRVRIQNPSLISGYPFTLSFMMKLDAQFPNHLHVVFAGLHNTTTEDPSIRIQVEYLLPYKGQLSATILNGGSFLGDVSGVQINDGKVHHIAEVFTNSTTSRMYVDGVATTGGFAGPTTWPGNPATAYTIGNFTDVTWGDYNFIGILDEFCVWNGTALSAGTIAGHALAAKTGWDGDDTGARVTRFLDAINWPSSLRTINTGVSILGPANWSAGTSALSVLQDWADTEYGLFFIDGSGKIVWKSRHARYLDATSLTSQATFGDRTSGQALRYTADRFELTRDEALIRNPVTASRAGGVSVTVKDQTLIDNKYWYLNWSAPPTQDQKDSAVRDRALWLLARYKEAATRLKSMRIVPQSNPSGLWPQALGREIGDRITIKRTPLGTGNQTSVDVWIESVKHEFAPKQWSTTFAGSPTETQSYLVLNDAAKGLLNTNTLSY